MQKLSQMSDRITKNTFHAKVQARIDESNGKFNFKALREAYRQGLQSDDHADYVSPSVLVNPAGSTGRGLYTVKDVKAGELLLCTRAFSMGKGIEGVISRAIQELLTNPSRIEEFSKVAGPGTGFPSVDDMKFIDGKLVIDQFESALYCEAYAISPSRDMIGNGLKPRGEHSAPFTKMNLEVSALKSAFWIIPSVIRHSCVGNITYGSIGDFGIFRASKDIAAGEQVLMQYSASQFKLMRMMGFQCDCSLCTMKKGRRIGKIAKAKTLSTWFSLSLGLRNRFGFRRWPVTEIIKAQQNVAKALEESYNFQPSPDHPRVDLGMVYFLIAVLHLGKRDFEGTRSAIIRVLLEFGYEINESSHSSVIHKHGTSSGCGDVIIIVCLQMSWLIQKRLIRGNPCLWHLCSYCK
jgi:hypothetical protein